MKTLKEKVEQEKGKEAFPATGQKLIYAGNKNNFMVTSQFNISSSYLQITFLRIQYIGYNCRMFHIFDLKISEPRREKTGLRGF